MPHLGWTTPTTTCATDFIAGSTDSVEDYRDTGLLTILEPQDYSDYLNNWVIVLLQPILYGVFNRGPRDLTTRTTSAPSRLPRPYFFRQSSLDLHPSPHDPRLKTEDRNEDPTSA